MKAKIILKLCVVVMLLNILSCKNTISQKIDGNGVAKKACNLCPNPEDTTKYTSWFHESIRVVATESVRAPFVFGKGDALISKNGLFKMTTHGWWHIVSKCRLEYDGKDYDQGSIWNPLASRTENNTIFFEENGNLKVIDIRGNVVWNLNLNPEKCGNFYLQLTDQGNLQITTDCGRIIWESRTDTNQPQVNGSELGFLVGNECRNFSGELYPVSCLDGAVINSNPIPPKISDFVLPECNSLNCIIPDFSIEEICKYVVGCSICDGSMLCAGEFIFEVEDDFEANLIKGGKVVAISKKIGNVVRLKTPKDVSIKDYAIKLYYKKSLSNQKVNIKYENEN